jgi:hypothetical protein
MIQLRIMSKLTIGVEFLKALNLEELAKKPAEPSVNQMMEVFLSPIKADDVFEELKDCDISASRLYLEENTLALFGAYTSIVTYAISVLKVLSIPNGGFDLLNQGKLREKVEKLVPASKGGFEKYGESYAFYWVQYFYDEIENALRAEALGRNSDELDVEKAHSVARGSLEIQAKLESFRTNNEIPEDIFYDEGGAPDLPEGYK